MGISWRREVWPFQWKIAVSWLCDYFIFQLFTPVLFAFRGPVEAGQDGALDEHRVADERDDAGVDDDQGGAFREPDCEEGDAGTGPVVLPVIAAIDSRCLPAEPCW